MEDIEDPEFVASEHDRLVNAISKLDKTQHITDPTRNEPTNLNSEFNLIKRSNKLDLKNVVKVLEDTAHHVQISKKLKKSTDASKTLPKPLEKPQADRIKRSTGYEATKTKVGRWDPVVARSRTVDYISFPIKHVSNKMQPTGEFLSKFKLKSELEKELEEIDPPAFVDDDIEEEKSYPMTYEEMVEHRQHLAKLRAQQSYKAAKAKRQSKIKSKKYHRILKKEKLKQQLKEFEELQIQDPEEALKRLEALEKARALERHTLRHKNTGKWAKSKLVRAKYDKEVRQQLAEQLAVSRGLTTKTQDMSSDDDADENEVIPDITLSQDPMNPWMMQRSDKSNVDAEFDFRYKKYLKDKMYKKKDDSDSDSDDELNKSNKESELNVLKQSVSKLSEAMPETEAESEDIHPVKKIKTEDSSISKKNITKETYQQKTKKSKSKPAKLVATSQWLVESINDEEIKPKEDVSAAFDSLQDNVAKMVEDKLKKLRSDYERLEKMSKNESKTKSKKNKSENVDNLEYLKMKNHKQKAIIDEELIETSAKNDETEPEKESLSKIINTVKDANTQQQENTNSNIDPNRFIEVKPKYLNTALSQVENEYDQLDDDEQVVPKVNIEEVFEEDDVVASFRQEKEDEMNKDKPEDIDLSLPGWGSWGGKGVKAPKRKRNRFILKAPPKVARRDENKGGIIIKEYKEPKLASHKVSDVPFPFTSVKEYEASIRAPLGNTFVPEKAHKKLIRPNVITKAGAIIEPMDEEELLVKRNRVFKNDAVLKLLAK